MVLIIQKEIFSCQSHLSFPHAGCHGDTSYINQSCWGVRWLVRAINNILSSSKEMTRKTNYSLLPCHLLSQLHGSSIRGRIPYQPSRLLIPSVFCYPYDLDAHLTYYKAVLGACGFRFGSNSGGSGSHILEKTFQALSYNCIQQLSRGMMCPLR